MLTLAVAAIIGMVVWRIATVALSSRDIPIALALLAIKARRSGEPLEWTAALQDSMSSVSAAVATVCYVMLQLLRLALVFLIIGTGSTGVYGNLAVILDPFSRIFTAHFSLCNTCRVGVMQVGVPCHP